MENKTLEALANILDPNSSFRKKFPDTWQKELDDILKFNNDLRCDNCGGIGRKYWPSMDEFLDYSHYFVATFDITDPNKGKKLYNWMRGLTDNGGNLSRTLPIMDEMNQTLRYLYNNKGIDVEQLIGFGSRIDGTTKFTDILKKGKSKFIELKSVKRGVGVEDLTDELNVLSGLNSNPLKNRTQFVDQFVNGYMKSIKSLDELKYVFDLYKLGDGGEDFIKKQFKELFEKKADDIFDAMTPELKAALEIKNRKGLTEKKIEEIINTIVKVE